MQKVSLATDGTGNNIIVIQNSKTQKLNMLTLLEVNIG